MRGRKLISKGLNFVKLVLSKYNAYTFGLIAVDNKYEVYKLKRQCPDAKYLDVEVSLYAIVEDQFSTPDAKIFLSSYIIKVVGLLLHAFLQICRLLKSGVV